MRLVAKMAGGSAAATLSETPGSSHGKRSNLASEYEILRTEEIAMRVEYQKIRIQKLKGEVVATKYIAEMIDATFSAIKAKILALDRPLTERIAILEDLASVELILEPPASDAGNGKNVSPIGNKFTPAVEAPKRRGRGRPRKSEPTASGET
jgi:hypothetical protein